jgi:hypothetical protein
MKMKLPYERTSEAIKGYSESLTAKTETNDCVVRAFASSFGVTYDDAHKYVAEKFNRKPRNGTYMTVPRLVKMSNDDVSVNGKKVYPLGKKQQGIFTPYSLSYEVKVKGEIKMRKMTVGTFIKKNPIGTFFVIVTGHAFTIKDGVVIGNWEDAVKTKRPMRAAFQIK